MIDLNINNNISAKKVLLIDDGGKNLGLKDLEEALRLAQSKSLDLVEISNNNDQSVCKILNYSKYKYSSQKKEKEMKRNQKVQQLKEVKLRPRIDTHDLNVKINSIKKFLKEKDKVKISLFFKGREIDYMKEIGEELINKIINTCKDEKLCKGNADFKLEGKYLTTILNPM